LNINLKCARIFFLGEPIVSKGQTGAFSA
jgi:hypothetical protein